MDFRLPDFDPCDFRSDETGKTEMTDDFPDLHHKLSKKLAHLTQGFYYLSVKSDETEHEHLISILDVFNDDVGDRISCGAKIAGCCNEIGNQHNQSDGHDC